MARPLVDVLGIQRMAQLGLVLIIALRLRIRVTTPGKRGGPQRLDVTSSGGHYRRCAQFQGRLRLRLTGGC